MEEAVKTSPEYHVIGATLPRGQVTSSYHNARSPKSPFRKSETLMNNETNPGLAQRLSGSLTRRSIRQAGSRRFVRSVDRTLASWTNAGFLALASLLACILKRIGAVPSFRTTFAGRHQRTNQSNRSAINADSVLGSRSPGTLNPCRRKYDDLQSVAISTATSCPA